MGDSREVTLSVVTPDGEPVWQLQGVIAGPSADAWAITDAYNRNGKDPSLHWDTPAGGRPGSLDGPLAFYFGNGIAGADVYVHGYLHLKRTRRPGHPSSLPPSFTG
jgi:hypothetical protein